MGACSRTLASHKAMLPLEKIQCTFSGGVGRQPCLLRAAAMQQAITWTHIDVHTMHTSSSCIARSAAAAAPACAASVLLPVAWPPLLPGRPPSTAVTLCSIISRCAVRRRAIGAGGCRALLRVARVSVSQTLVHTTHAEQHIMRWSSGHSMASGRVQTIQLDDGGPPDTLHRCIPAAIPQHRGARRHVSSRDSCQDLASGLGSKHSGLPGVGVSRCL
jgi:hypothetical protein